MRRIGKASEQGYGPTKAAVAGELYAPHQQPRRTSRRGRGGSSPHQSRISWSGDLGHLASVFLCVVDVRRRGITLAEACPDVALQWHQVKNGELTASDVAAGTHRVVWWIAACGHEWDMAVRLRTRKPSSGCPYCAGKRVLPQESLAARRPLLAQEWHTEKNGELAPEAVTVGSNRRVWWICRTCAHEWAAPVVRRTQALDDKGCPGCAGQVVTQGRSFADLFPELAGEWHTDKNGQLTAHDVTAHSGRRVWWRCRSCGRQWQAAVNDRAADKGCPTCRPPGWSQVAIRLGAELATLLPVGNLELEPQVVKKETGWEPDIVLPAERIAIDVDGRFWHGDSHHKTRGSQDRDQRKVQAMAAADWTLVRVREAPLKALGPADVVVADLRRTKDVVVAIVDHLVAAFPLTAPRLEEYRAGPGLAAEDAAERVIARYQQGTVAGRTVADLFPDVAAYWHPTKNGVVTPATIFAQSNRMAWWQCEQGHESRATVQSRTQQSRPGRNGCPYCSGNKAGQGNTLADLHPDLAAQWHPIRNPALTPDQVTLGTTRIVWWLCDSEHEWQASIASRVAGRGCPYCSGHRPSPGHNLARSNPQLAAQWHPDRNAPLTPAQVTPGSNRKVWWLCAAGHEWEAAVADRQAGRGCPFCSGRKAGQGITLAEVEPALAEQWHPNLNGVLTPGLVTAHSNRLVWWQCTRGHDWQAVVSNRTNGNGCPYCAGQRAVQGNTLTDVTPELAAEWHPRRNDALRPDQVKATATRTVWWLCKRGHEWQAPIRSRTNGSACPYCTGRRATAEHNLAVLWPDVAAQWHPSKNENLTAEQVTPGSDRKVWWRCPAGHVWQAGIDSRVRATGCPYCTGHRVGQGNTLADLHPQIAAQWHPTRNDALTPEQVTPGLNTGVWWNCAAGHVWQAAINSRVRGTGCPYCSGRRATSGRNMASVHPELAAQWHPTKNGDLKPDQVPPRSR